MLTTFTVTNLDDSGEGSLRDAIDDANMDVGADVIEFAPNVQGTVGLTSELEITDDLTINGPGQGKLTVSGGGSTRVFSNTAEAAINHLTISDGHVSGFGGVGGGILNRGTLSLDHVTMNNNEAVDTARGGGGAVANFIFATLNVSNSTFENNRATNSTAASEPVTGGAIANIFSSANIRDSRFTGNEVDSGVSAGIGGAISNTFNGTLEVSNSRFEGNAVSSDVDARGGALGAGFGFGGDAVTVEHSLFVGNSAIGASAIGGAIWADVSSFTLDHSSIVNNRAIGAEALGGGIYNNGSFTLTKSNVNANRAIGDGGDGVGGGIYNVGTFETDKMSNVHGNKASTSDDNVFGALTPLDEAFADPTLL